MITPKLTAREVQLIIWSLDHSLEHDGDLHSDDQDDMCSIARLLAVYLKNYRIMETIKND